MLRDFDWLQNKNSEFSAPLTSFDWNETDLNRLGTSSIDTTCTIWDIEVGLKHICWRCGEVVM